MPIPLEKIRDLKHIVTHDKCPDGTASAMILKLCFPTAEVRFVQYSTPEHESLDVRPGTIFVDFSPHDKQVSDFVKAEAVVLDHHKTQRDVVAEFGELGVFGDEATEPGVCGAVLAFREVWVPLKQRSSLPVESYCLRDLATVLRSGKNQQADSNRLGSCPTKSFVTLLRAVVNPMVNGGPNG